MKDREREREKTYRRASKVTNTMFLCVCVLPFRGQCIMMYSYNKTNEMH